MKSEQVKATLQLSSFESKVYDIIFKSGKIKCTTVAKEVFKYKRNKPKSVSNSVTSAIRQINRKFQKNGWDYRIIGKPNGRGGKTVCFGYADYSE